MAVLVRPAEQRSNGGLDVLSIASGLVLLSMGIGISRLVTESRFSLSLLFAALIALLPLSAVVIVRPRFGVFMLFAVATVIIELKRLDWGLEVGLALEFIEGLLAIGIAVSIVARRNTERLSSPLTLPVLIYIAYEFVISFHPGLPTISNVLYALRSLVDFSVPFFGAVYLIRNGRQLRYFLFLWLGSAVVIGLYGLKQHFFGLTSFEWLWVTISPTHVLDGQIRIFSTVGSADELGMYMAIAIVLTLGVAFQRRNWKVLCFGVVALPLFALTDLYTLTRGAYLGVLVGVVALAVITRSRSLLVVLVLLAALVVGWYQFNQDSYLANRVVSVFAPQDDQSFTVRQDYLQEYFPFILENPFGLGPDTSGRQGWVLLERTGVDPTLFNTVAGVPTDNYYFRIALEQGWVGLLWFFGLLISVFSVGLYAYHKIKLPQNKWLCASLLSSYVALTVCSVSNNYFSYQQLELYFWFTLGVLANLPLIDRTERSALMEGAPPTPPLTRGGRA